MLCVPKIKKKSIFLVVKLEMEKGGGETTPSQAITMEGGENLMDGCACIGQNENPEDDGQLQAEQCAEKYMDGTQSLIANEESSSAIELKELAEQTNDGRGIQNGAAPAKRIASLDILKSFAALAVVLSHAGLRQRHQYKLYYKNEKLSYWIWANLYCALGRIGTHLFMVVTAIIMLSPKRLNDSATSTMKYVVRRMVQYTLWMIPYNFKLFEAAMKLATPFKRIRQMVNIFFANPGTLWYLQIAMRMLMIVPFVRQAVKATSRKVLEMTILSIFVSHHLLHTFLVGMQIGVWADAFVAMFLTFLVGYYCWTVMEHQRNPSAAHPSWVEEPGYLPILGRVNWQSKVTALVCFGVFVLASLCNWGLVVLTGHYAQNAEFWRFYEYYGLPTTFAFAGFACGIYALTCKWKPTSRFEKCVMWYFSSTGSCTLGIYLLNEFAIFRFVADYLFPKVLKKSYYDMNPLWFTPLLCVSVYLTTWIVTALWQKIPLLKRLVM
ncbi:putative Acyltransferase family [Monocercomonoides exilis]|uniref:putative Acyltransferase family n=1 Tax=Monocercomonoides exilis TaxID=2049356 RepID=UPI003559E91A|nr:putative Acyltransferase family [Monocercomonoides exilis]|eukprot:MONOS_13640.1-p1 / transcript=MONOS_13640.1 / gene=MONOS_13640 / organism=Monocercomonoides_exilis_PA203 / gene_product=unspecified product / transcript_product=unspecified product / location=Mono_scaffold00857:411-2242(+) / protein_length=493 / sequence_SO=supercontig / SO=protein_coding / is_pseudo=false